MYQRSFKFLIHIFKGRSIHIRRLSSVHDEKSLKMKNLAAVLQLNVSSDKERNFTRCRELLRTAATRGATMAFLPECFDFIGENPKQTLELAEFMKETANNGDHDDETGTVGAFRELAKELNLWLSLGGFHRLPSPDSKLIANTHIIINSSGELVGTYDKTHLFDVDIPGKVRLAESNYVLPGSKIGPPIDTPLGKIGMAVCYDMRFPECSILLTRQGAEILTYPSAFTVPTGHAHWESLLRSRAIENQCYVIAAAQVGTHNVKRSSYGHSMIIDPWGTIIAQSSDHEGVILAEIDLDYLKSVRETMPVLNHRRFDLYGLASSSPHLIHPEEELEFGQVKIPGSCVVYKSEFSYISVNKKPVLPGHLLVIPLRKGAVRLSDLTPGEIADLFILVQLAERLTMKFYKAESATVTIQDGPEAGQSIRHLHVHVLPRKSGDFKRNDEIYEVLESHDKGPEVKWREKEEMDTEAALFRTFLLENLIK